MASLLQISSLECSHREHEKGKTLVLGFLFPPSDLECFCRESNRTLAIAQSKARVGDSSSELTDVLIFVGGPKELEGAHVFRLAPPGHLVPERLIYEDVVARAISRADLQEDVRGINASLELIRRTRGGTWPTGEITEEFNFVDLVWHEAEFRDGGSYSYAVYDTNDPYLGCCYLYPMGRRIQLTEELLKYDVDVSWWVTPPAYAEGYYTKLYRALGHWLAEELTFKNPYYSNREIPAG